MHVSVCCDIERDRIGVVALIALADCVVPKVVFDIERMLANAEMGGVDAIAEPVLAVALKRINCIPGSIMAFVYGLIHVDTGIVQTGSGATQIFDEE